MIHATSNPPRARRRTAFALPIVLMVSLALATMIAVVLERFGSQTRSVASIVNAYENYHVERGIHQLFEAWMRTTNQQKFAGKLGENGLALTVTLPDGISSHANSPERLQIFLVDGQGSILTEPTGLPAEDVALAQSIVNAARELEATSSSSSGSSTSDAEGSIAHRDFGPLAVSVRTASAKTLRAAIAGAIGADKAGEIVAELLKARDDGSLTSASLGDITNKASLAGDARNRLLKAITVEPVLWNINAEIRSDRLIGGGLLLRYRGTALVSSGAAAANVTTPRSVIRQWTREDFR
jgi:hypothetical protein